MNENDSGLSRYMRDIGRFPLLTVQQETELADKIKKGDAEARERMINSNLRLVVTIAHDYANLGLPLLDLISEGNVGLTKAVERFDPAKGAKLSTYAMWWIKQSIKRALANQSKTKVTNIAGVTGIKASSGTSLWSWCFRAVGFAASAQRLRVSHAMRMSECGVAIERCGQASLHLASQSRQSQDRPQATSLRLQNHCEWSQQPCRIPLIRALVRALRLVGRELSGEFRPSPASRSESRFVKGHGTPR